MNPIRRPGRPLAQGRRAKGREALRAVAEVSGQFSPEESAPLHTGMDEVGGRGPTPPKQALKPDAPAVMTSRFEPKDTATAFSALDWLAKTPNVLIMGGSIDLNGARSEADFLTLRLGRDVPVPASDLDALVKTLVAKLNAPAPSVKLRLDDHFPPVGTLRNSAMIGETDRVEWNRPNKDRHRWQRRQFRCRRHLSGTRLPRTPHQGA